METNFFKQIAEMNITGNLQITISKGAGGNLIVSTILLNDACGDKAKDLITPFNLRGTYQELDEGYFGRITQPIETASGLMDNMETYVKQLEEVRKQSIMEKEKADRDKKAKEERERKYKEAMQKVDELDRNGKFREAWVKLPDPALFPEQAETISRRRTALSAKFAPDLFACPEATTATQRQTKEEYTCNANPGDVDDCDEDNESD